ncbi:MAG: RNA 2',3'-cyclic phosphodiesterase [bacterium]|nr:RNA 2',3'-cyclic phosphodiesterase [bacterium]
MNLIRCFIALELPSPVQKHLAQVITRLKEAKADIKWVEPENTHLTLKFLGGIFPEQVQSSRKVLLDQNGKHPPIHCRTGQIGIFPGWNRPQVIWLGLIDGVQRISDLQLLTENGLADCGFARDPKKFKPHLTLGRVRSPNNMDKLAERIRTLPLEEIEFSFEELALIKSTLTQSGPVYQTLETIKLS